VNVQGYRQPGVPFEDDNKIIYYTSDECDYYVLRKAQNNNAGEKKRKDRDRDPEGDDEQGKTSKDGNFQGCPKPVWFFDTKTGAFINEAGTTTRSFTHQQIQDNDGDLKQDYLELVAECVYQDDLSERQAKGLTLNAASAA
jgi:hypothetical protein